MQVLEGNAPAVVSAEERKRVKAMLTVITGGKDGAQQETKAS